MRWDGGSNSNLWRRKLNPRKGIVGVAALILAIANTGCTRSYDVNDAKQAYSSQKATFKEIAEIAKKHSEIRRYEIGSPNSDDVTSAASRQAYKRVSALMEHANAQLVEVSLTDFVNQKPTFLADFMMSCHGWHRGSECIDIIYDQDDTVRVNSEAETCNALSDPHWYVCDER